MKMSLHRVAHHLGESECLGHISKTKPRKLAN